MKKKKRKNNCDALSLHQLLHVVFGRHIFVVHYDLKNQSSGKHNNSKKIRERRKEKK